MDYFLIAPLTVIRTLRLHPLLAHVECYREKVICIDKIYID